MASGSGRMRCDEAHCSLITSLLYHVSASVNLKIGFPWILSTPHNRAALHNSYPLTPTPSPGELDAANTNLERHTSPEPGILWPILSNVPSHITSPHQIRSHFALTRKNVPVAMSSFTHRYHDEEDDDNAASPHGNIDADTDVDMDTEMDGPFYAMQYTQAHNPLPQTYQYHYHRSPAPQTSQAQHFSGAQQQQQPPLHNLQTHLQHDPRPNRPAVPRTPPQTPISPSAPTHAHTRSTDSDSALFTHTADISLFAAALSGMHLDPSAPAPTPTPAPTFSPESQHEQANEHSLFAAAVAGLPAPPSHDDEDPVMRVADAMAEDMVDDDGSGGEGGGEARAPGDVLPDYEQSQREAANLRRRAALRRAAELEARWKGVR